MAFALFAGFVGRSPFVYYGRFRREGDQSSCEIHIWFRELAVPISRPGISSGSLKSGNCVPVDERERVQTNSGKIFPRFAFHPWRRRFCDSVCYFEAKRSLRVREILLHAAVGVRLISQKISPVCLHVAIRMIESVNEWR